MDEEFTRSIERVEEENRAFRNKIVELRGKLYVFHKLSPELAKSASGHTKWVCSCGASGYVTSVEQQTEANMAHRQHIMEAIE